MKSWNYISIVNAGTKKYVGPEELFRPSTRYPEYEFGDLSKAENKIYDAVRNTLIQLEMDKEHIGTPEWNPFKEIISEGDTVLIKPNFVQDFNCNPKGGVECLYTQPSVVAPVVDYAYKALKGTGRVIIGDAPMQECNLPRLVEESGYDNLVKYYMDKGFDIELIDFRKAVTVVKHRISSRTDKDAPSKVIDLGNESEFAGLSLEKAEKLRIVSYPHENIVAHHHGDVQQYCVSQYILDADVVINMPKPKTHKKAGVTIALKNLVGINAQKDYLPHHTFGSKEEGGDEYKNKNALQHFRGRLYDIKYKYEDQHKLFRAQLVWFVIAFCTLTLRLFGTKYENGSWYGNETISKTIVDLNKILRYADKNGIMQDTIQRKYFIVADMVISGEKDGPVAPSPKPLGIVAAGYNPFYFDRTIATLMGFDIEKIPTLRQIKVSKSKYKLFNVGDKEVIVSNISNIDGKTIETLKKEDTWGFIAPGGWEGHIEKKYM
jgi:uncharacterized protein (DUF362 family)